MNDKRTLSYLNLHGVENMVGTIGLFLVENTRPTFIYVTAQLPLDFNVNLLVRCTLHC